MRVMNCTLYSYHAWIRASEVDKLIYCLKCWFHKFKFVKYPHHQGDFKEVGFGTWQPARSFFQRFWSHKRSFRSTADRLYLELWVCQLRNGYQDVAPTRQIFSAALSMYSDFNFSISKQGQSARIIGDNKFKNMMNSRVSPKLTSQSMEGA